MSWDTSAARTVAFTVKVDGYPRPHESLDWGQDITSDLPAAVTAGGQVAVRTGTIVWSRQELVETRTPNPWYKGSRWVPATGERVTIDATDGTNTHRVFTGVIDTVEGDAHGRRVSKIVAEVERHNKVVRYQALTRYGSPVAAPTGNGYIRRQATTPVWLIHEITRELGYQAVPPRPSDSKLILDAPLQGSTYNYFQSAPNGEMVVSHRPGYPALAPTWSWGADGFGVSDAEVEWVPRTGGGTGAGSVGISFLVYSAHAAAAAITVHHGSNTVKVTVSGTKTLTVESVVGGTTTTRDLAPTIPAGDGPHRVSLIFRGGSMYGVIAGETQAITIPTPPIATTRIALRALAGACVAGLQVWHPSSVTDHHAPGWAPTARFRYGTGTHSTICTPSVRDQKARDVLDEYAAALLSPIWIDGAGVLQIVTGKALHQQAPSLTVDALGDVSELSYSLDSLDHRPTVDVSYEHAHHATPQAETAMTPVWQGSGVSVLPGTPDETFVEVPGDEEWIMVSDPATMSQYLWPNGDVATFNAQRGSWWGFRYENTSDTHFMSTNVSQTVETLTPWAWKITTTTTDPDGVQAKTPKQYGTIPARLRDMDLPIIRSRSKIKYESRTVSATTGNDPYQGVLSHDTGKWVTTTAAATDLCQWVHSMVSTPTPILGNLVIGFNPLADVGKKITVKAQPVFGVDFEALILSADHTPYDGTTRVTARVTKVTGYADTIDAVDYAHIGQSLAAWDQARSGMTLDQVAAAPYL